MSKVFSRLLASLLSALSHFRQFRQSFVFSPFDHQLYDALVTGFAIFVWIPSIHWRTMQLNKQQIRYALNKKAISY